MENDNELHTEYDNKMPSCKAVQEESTYTIKEKEARKASATNSPLTGFNVEFIESKKRKFIHEPSNSDDIYDVFGENEKPKNSNKRVRTSNKLSLSGKKNFYQKKLR